MMMKLSTLIFCALVTLASPALAESKSAAAEPTMSFFFRDAPVAELFEMLSRKERVSIMLSRGITGTVTVNLYDVTLKQAIYAIAEAAGYGVEERAGGYMILDRQNASSRPEAGNIQVRTMRVQYSDPQKMAEILRQHLSRTGKITVLDERKMLVVEDTPDILDRFDALLKEIDKQPAQILIEAKILEITLDASDTFGIDWSRVFRTDGITLGVQGLASRGTPGLFFNVVNDNINLFLTALSSKGKVHTLATPKLLTLDNQEAVTNVGDKIGYRVTTTINNISTESVNFLETGIILRVTPSIDSEGRIAMKIRPEVSSGNVSGGVPSKKTTEVSTQLVALNGQSILIAGLIKNSNGYRRSGVPVLGEVPGLGRLFSRTESVDVATETVVIITPRIVNFEEDASTVARVNASQQTLTERQQHLDHRLNILLPALP